MRVINKILILSIIMQASTITKPDNIFGTDGIRSQVGIYPLDNISIIKLGDAIGAWAQEKYGTCHIKALIVKDTRSSCPEIVNLLKPGLLKHNILIDDKGVLPTPVAFYLSDLYDFSLVISASHNPAKDNGIKIIDKSKKLKELDEKRITQLFYLSEATAENPAQKYIDYVLGSFKDLDLSNTKIVLDTANGAQYNIAPEILKKLGANLVVINNNPDGDNINCECGSTHPEVLQKTVLENNADIGFAFDGDGDRIIVVDKNGTIKDGDDILALLSSNPDYKDGSFVIGTILANYGLEEYLKSQNKNLIRTPVGDKHIAKQLKELDSLLGGEPSGHIILKNMTNTGDGIIVALKILETLKYTQNSFINYDKYDQISINLPVTYKKDLGLSPIKEIIDSYKNKISGRLIIRYSGTENLLRIMAESLNKLETELLIEQLILDLKPYLT